MGYAQHIRANGAHNQQGAHMPATLFYSDKGWMVSVRTAIGFQHTKVAGPGSSRPTADELRAKGYET